MTASGTLLLKSRLSNNSKNKFLKRHRQQNHLLKPFQTTTTNPMSDTLIRELDYKMQQVREYALIAHGYHNENLQYPVHVRRSHDGEKVPRIAPIVSHRKKTRTTDSTILTPSSHENRTKTKAKDLSNRHLSSSDDRQTTLIVPPNKTINDIDPALNCERFSSHRTSSLSSTNSSPILCSNRPHSIAGLSLPTTDEQQTTITSLSTSSHSLVNQSSSTTTTTKTLTQRFFSKFFHHPSKS